MSRVWLLPCVIIDQLVALGITPPFIHFLSHQLVGWEEDIYDHLVARDVSSTVETMGFLHRSSSIDGVLPQVHRKFMFETWIMDLDFSQTPKKMAST